jgi:lipid-binding SYLF domain-containing protein
VHQRTLRKALTKISFLGQLNAYGLGMTKALLLTSLVTVGMLAQEVTPDKRLQDGRTSFQDTMASPDKGIPQDQLEKADCIIIVPGLIKGAFGVTGKYGRGFATCRTPECWSSPAGVRIEGGTFGLQSGASSTDGIMLLMNQSGLNRWLGDTG